MADQVRGSDATGITWMNKAGHTDWLKTNENATDYLKRPDVYKFFGRLNSDGVVLGHNRAKTFGANTSINAHPFDVGTKDSGVIGVHNGTIRNKYALCTNGYKFDVDSEAFFHGVHEHGIDETVKKADGAFSVVYLDKETNTVNFVRNTERPMWMLRATDKTIPTDEKEFIFFGSELMMLMWIVQRNGFKIGEHFETVPFEHYSFDLDNIKPRVRTLEKPAPVAPYVHSASHSSAWDDEIENYYGGRYGKKQKWQDSDRGSVIEIGTSKVAEIKPTTIITPNDSLTDLMPYELSTSTFLKSASVDGQTKRHFIKVWRSTKRLDPINFKITDMVAIVEGSKWQICGKLAGRKKENFPVVVSAIMDDKLVSQCNAESILCGNLTLKRVMDGGKSYEFIVDNVTILDHTKSYLGETECA